MNLDIFAYGGQVTLIGLSIVFIALIILIVCISLLSKVIRLFSRKPAEKKAAPAPAPAPAPVQAAPVVAEPVKEEPAAEPEAVEEELVTDPQIIAVIAAAIAACDANSKLVIRSVKRASGWKKTARSEAVSRF